MKGILSFLAGLASAFGLAWLYNNNQQFRQTVDEARDQIREKSEAAAENINQRAQSTGEKLKRNASKSADAARRAVFTRASARSKSGEKQAPESTADGTVDLNACSREDLVRLGLSDELAAKVLENRPYRNKMDLISRLVIPDTDYQSIKHFVSVDDKAANKSVNVAS